MPELFPRCFFTASLAIFGWREGFSSKASEKRQRPCTAFTVKPKLPATSGSFKALVICKHTGGAMPLPLYPRGPPLPSPMLLSQGKLLPPPPNLHLTSLFLTIQGRMSSTPKSLLKPESSLHSFCSLMHDLSKDSQP